MTDGIGQLMELKSKFEQTISQLSEERDSLKSKINSKREEKSAILARKKDDLLKLYKLKVTRMELLKQVEMYQSYVSEMNGMAKKIESSVTEQVRINDFEKEIMKVVSNLEASVNFYREDSLQMELMKRTNSVRERRVELTVAESEYQNMLRKIEERKREKDRQRMAEEQKMRDREEQEKRDQFLESRAVLMKAPSPAPLLRRDSAPEIPNGGFSQFMHW